MSPEPKTIVVEISGPQASGKTTLAAILSACMREVGLNAMNVLPGGERVVPSFGPELRAITRLRLSNVRLEVRETEYDDRDRELASLRQERDRLRQDVERLKAEVARQSDKARGFDK